MSGSYESANMKINILGKSVEGASHKRAGKECQDNHKFLEKMGNVVILAAADGHGSESCPFSKSGSTIAVNVFCKLMSDYCDKYAKDMETLLAHFDRSGDTIARAIDKEWKRRVEELHRKNKRKIPQTESGENDKQGIWRQYGTTLLGLVITPAFYFAFQLGDGDILLLRQNETESIIKSDKILGTETHSLSRAEAWKKAISSVGHIPDETDTFAFMIATDGFSNSYPTEAAFLQSCSDYYAAIREHGITAVSNNLKSWLDETSKNGSGDDITVLFAVVDTFQSRNTKRRLHSNRQLP